MDVLILIFLLLWSRICNNKNMEKKYKNFLFLEKIWYNLMNTRTLEILILFIG